MEDYLDPLPRNTIKTMYDSWCGAIKRRECFTVVSLPRFDRHYRAAQFVREKTKKFENTSFKVLSLQSLVTEVAAEFLQKLDSLRLTRGQTVFLVTDAEWLISAAPHLIHVIQAYILNTDRNVSFVWFFERNITSSETQQLFLNAPSFLQNLEYQKLYSDFDMAHFLEHMARMYDYVFHARERERIVRECAGYIWLTTEALRHLHATGTLSFDHTAMRHRLDSVWEGMSQSEKKVLRSVVLHQPIQRTNSEDLTYLLHTGLLVKDKQEDSYKLSVPVFEQYLNSLFKEDKLITLDIHGDLIFGSVPVTHYFSKREHSLLKYMLVHLDEVISRDRVGESLWGENWQDAYTDWGLNQAIKRLRDKLQKMSINLSVSTVKGKGYRVSY